MARLALLLALLVAAASPALAQDLPIRWGTLSDAEKEMSAWPDDPDASAIILGDVGRARVEFQGGTGRPHYVVDRHLRIKVLREEGYELGEFAMRYSKDDRVDRVRGQTFTPEGDGYREVKLEGRDIREDVVSDEVRELRFSMPALAPGAIFEIKYTHTTDAISVVRPWLFQASEPTVVSEFRFETPQYFEYVVLRQGASIRADEAERVPGRDYYSTRMRWVAEGLPALRDEPFTTTEADYVERIALQLQRVVPPNGFPENVLSSWEVVARELRDNEYFGRRMRGTRRVREIVERAEGTASEKARALYDIVRTEYVWDGRGGSIFADRDLDDVIKTKTGTEAELTMLYLALLKEAGVPATPVALSGRSNGRAVIQYPIMRQFDTLLALVQAPGDEPRLVSPTSLHRPYGEVPVDALNGQAWVVDYDAPQWIDFSPPSHTSTTTLAKATLAEDGTLSGELSLRFVGYDATHLRERLAEDEAESPSGSGAAVGEATDADEAEIETVSVSGEVGEPFAVEATFRAPSAEVVGDEMYVVPFVAMQMDENPFEREARAFPVDYAYPRTRTYVANIDLPEGWAAVDLPDPVQMSIPSGSVSYLRVVGPSPDGRGVQVRAVMTVRGVQVQPDEYPALRRLYDEIVATEAEALVVARQPASAAPPSEPAAAGGDDPETEADDAEADGGEADGGEADGGDGTDTDERDGGR